MSSTQTVEALVLHGPKDLRLVRTPHRFDSKSQHTDALNRSPGQHLSLVPEKSKSASKRRVCAAQTCITTIMAEMATLSFKPP
jgi:hypothetical protein